MENIPELPNDITELDLPFKISAGPGAGKTTWLVRHVQNVIKNSDRLDKTKKVACITYTRIGADTVNKKVKVETGTNRLDIGTIHSFLYRNVIKPFAFLIEKDNAGESLFNITELHGHTDHIPSFSRISSWIKTIGFKYSYLSKQVTDTNGLTNLDKSRSILSACDWVINGDDLKYIPRKNYHRELKFPTSKLTEYKQTCWEKGIMHHEDVLYFAHYIFKNYPRTIELVSNKFPYLFLDEFQDTNPLQTWIVKKLTTKGTVIGVIGDPAQSIFEFAGAQRKDFNEFDLPDLVTYKKSDNFRSTKKVVAFLKELRDDIEQQPPDKAEQGENVVILVGEASSAVKYVKELGDDEYAVLCRYNKDVNRLKYDIQNIQGENLISSLYSVDSINQRPRFIHSLLKAYDFFEHEEYKEAFKEINKHLRHANIDGMEKRKLAISIIEYLHENRDTQIIDIYNYWQTELKILSINMTRLGKAKDVYKNNFNAFLPFLSKQTKINSHIRTIHQAKGDEFNNVLLCLFDKTNKNDKVKKYLENIVGDYIFNAKENIKLDSNIGEETRLVYVACSRAKKKLFINVPRLSTEERDRFKKINVKILDSPFKETKKLTESEIIVDSQYINEQVTSFVNNSKSNPFYNKNVVFTTKLKGSKYKEFQIIGNLGGWADDKELTIDTDYFIISDSIINEITVNESHPLLQELNEKLNVYSIAEKKRIRNYKYKNLKIISEKVFLNHVMKRCDEINDRVTEKLINSLK